MRKSPIKEENIDKEKAFESALRNAIRFSQRHLDNNVDVPVITKISSKSDPDDTKRQEIASLKLYIEYNKMKTEAIESGLDRHVRDMEFAKVRIVELTQRKEAEQKALANLRQEIQRRSTQRRKLEEQLASLSALGDIKEQWFSSRLKSSLKAISSRKRAVSGHSNEIAKAKGECQNDILQLITAAEKDAEIARAAYEEACNEVHLLRNPPPPPL